MKKANLIFLKMCTWAAAMGLFFIVIELMSNLK